MGKNLSEGKRVQSVHNILTFTPPHEHVNL
jgi:hypothetical protein